MFSKIHRILEKRRRTGEGGSAIIFAIMVMMIMMLSVTIVTSASLANSKNSSSLQIRDALKQAAISAIQNALLRANNSLPADYTGYDNLFEKYRCPTANLSTTEAKLGCFGNLSNNTLGTQNTSTTPISNVAVGRVSTMSNNFSSGINTYWRWFTQKLAFNGSPGYYVYAIGYSTTAGVTEQVILQAEFSSLIVDAASFEYDNRVGNPNPAMPSYRQDTLSPWQYGITGTNGVTISGNLYSSDSNITFDPTDTGWAGTSVATNGSITLNSTTSGPAGVSFAQEGNAASCTNCSTRSVTIRNYILQYNPTLWTTGTLCPNAASSYPAAWSSSSGFPQVAALNGNSTYGNVYCVQSATFNASAELPAIYNDENPLIIVVAGTTTVSGGVRINQNGSPKALQVITNGVFSQANSGTTKTNMLVASKTADCNILGGKFFGALNCLNVNIAAPATMYIDVSASSLSPSANGVTIWSTRYYYEVA